MSWERYSHTRISPCACGAGKVVMIEHMASDDWNRIRSEGVEYEIDCDLCKINYHIACSGYHYLVPNGIEMPISIRRRSHYSFYSSAEEEIACLYHKEALQEAIFDMEKSTYSTRLKLEISRRIVAIYYHRIKRRNLPEIIACLRTVLEKYDDYKWNFNKIEEYRIREEKEINDNQAKNNAVIKMSFKLNF